MATYTYKDKDYEFDDNISSKDVLDLLSGGSSKGSAPASPSATPATFTAKADPSTSFFGSIDEKSLQYRKDWVDASRILFKTNTNTNFVGTDQDAAEYGKEQMGWFNSNLPVMAVDAAALRGQSQTSKQAFLYLMQTYDDLKMSWAGTGRWIKGAVTDPVNYGSLASFGLLTAGSTATRIASKEGIKSLLRSGVDAGVMGAVQAGVSDAARQSVEISADPTQEFSGGRLAANTGVGFGLGAVVGGAIDAGGTFLRGRRLPSEIAPTVEVPHAPAGPEPVAGYPVEPRQQSLGLGDMNDPNQAAQVRMDRDVQAGRFAGSTENPADALHGLPGSAESIQATREPMLPMHMPEGDAHPTKSFPFEQPRDPEQVALQDLFGSNHQEQLDLYLPPGQGDGYQHQLFPMHEQRAPKPGEAAVGGREPVVGTPVEPVSRDALTEALKRVQYLNKETGGNAGGAIIQAIKDAVNPDGWRIIGGSKPIVDGVASKALDLIRKLGVKDLNDAHDVFKAAGISPQQLQELKGVINQASSDAANTRLTLLRSEMESTGQSKIDAQKNLEKFDGIQNALAQMYKASSSSSGATLAELRGHILSGEARAFMSPEDLAKVDNKNWDLLTPKERKKYTDEWVAKMDDFKSTFSDDEAVKKLDTEILRLKDVGDADSHIKLQGLLNERANRLAILAEDAITAAGGDATLWRKANAKLSEYVVSTVFSPSTVIVNILPSFLKALYKPALNAFMDPNGSVKSLGHTYGAMWSMIPEAIKKFKMTFDYERQFLTGNVTEFANSEPAFKGQFGRVLRIFPRILAASDEMAAELHYRGFVVSESSMAAIKAGQEVGHTGKALDDFVSARVKDAVERSYSAQGDGIAVLDFLRQTGMRRGYEGDKLALFVQTELGKNESLMRKATSVDGQRYVDDILFRRKFSGDSSTSEFAQKYEAFMHQNALARIGFQLFIRTPIRVFEEGIRLTPGLNLIAPKFMADLSGKNGVISQVRAQGEASLSTAFAGAVLAMYSNNAITGGGPSDFRQRRGKENTGEWQPYTIFTGKGTISFRNLDPFATPMKIIVNALDNMMDYEYRKKQGQFRNNPMNDVLAQISVGSLAVMQAVTDSNLTDGLNQMATLVKDMGDLEKNHDAISRFFGQKLQLAVPNIIGKTQGLFAGDGGVPMRDPSTMLQMLEAKISPFDNDVPWQRDALGFKRVISNPTASYFGIGVNGLMDRDIPQKAKDVLKALSQLEQTENKSFVLPYKIPQFGEWDLREHKTADGRMSMYDRISDIYNASKAVDAFHNVLIKHNIPFGVPDGPGPRLKASMEIFTKFKENAILQFIKENNEAKEKMISTMKYKAMGQGGKLDAGPYPR